LGASTAKNGDFSIIAAVQQNTYEGDCKPTVRIVVPAQAGIQLSFVFNKLPLVAGQLQQSDWTPASAGVTG